MAIIAYSDLTDSQRNIANLPPTHNYIVTGEPGTGKTVIALHMAGRFAKRGKKVLFLIHNRPLKSFIETQVFGEEYQFTVSTLHQWLPLFFMQNFKKRVPTTDGKYAYAWADIMSCFATLDKQYDYIIFDEAQDFGLDVFKAAQMVAEHLVCLMDPEQSLTTGSVHLEELIDLLGVRNEYTLQDNYRNPREIFEFARLYGGSKTILHTNPTGKRPYFIQVPDYPEQNETINNIVKSHLEYKTIGVFTNTTFVNKANTELSAIIKDKPVFAYGVKTETSNGKDFDYSKEGVYIMPYGVVKGLEFDIVIIANCHRMFKSKNANDTNLFYVNCTRAKKELYCIYSTETCEDGCIDVFGPMNQADARNLVDWSLNWNLQTIEK